MSRGVTILGSTGSVGTQTLDVIARHPGAFYVAALVAGSNAAALAAQARRFSARMAVLADETHYAALKALLADRPDIAIGAGPAAVMDAASMEADITMASIVGVAGLEPTMRAVARGQCVAFANKECLVAAGTVMMRAVAAAGATFMPVDSEHNAIFQALAGNPAKSARRIVLTASGGPFRDASMDVLRAATPAQAIAHPTWSMGPKISVDSATLMNKALEVIEAHHLFSMPSEKIDVLVHPQSVVHGMVEYDDGSYMAQLGPADMRTPITVALGWPDRLETPGARMTLAAMHNLTFLAPDETRFPAMRLVREVLRAGPGASIAFNAANEVAVAAFLAGAIGFTAIVDTVARVLDAGRHTQAINTLEDVLALDSLTRAATRDALAPAASGSGGPVLRRQTH